MKVQLSNHAKSRSSLRLISKSEVIETLNNGLCHYIEDNKIKCIHNNIEVVFRIGNISERVVVIITMMYTNRFQNTIKKYARRNKISMRKATRLLKVS